MGIKPWAGHMSRLELTAEQAAQLQSELRQSASVQVYRRAAALLGAHQGRSVSQMAALLGVTRQSIYNWVKTYGRARGRLNLVDAPRSGRPSVWTPDLDAVLAETLRSPPHEQGCPGGRWTTALLIERLASRAGKRISGGTLRRRLRRLGLGREG